MWLIDIHCWILKCYVSIFFKRNNILISLFCSSCLFVWMVLVNWCLMGTCPKRCIPLSIITLVFITYKELLFVETKVPVFFLHVILKILSITTGMLQILCTRNLDYLILFRQYKKFRYFAKAPFSSKKNPEIIFLKYFLRHRH